jgi:hypothetical protein
MLDLFLARGYTCCAHTRMRARMRAHRAGRPIEGPALVKTMQELDADGSGEVDFGEFSLWWPKYCARLTSTRNRSGFDGVLGSAVDEVASQQSEGRVHFDAQLMLVVKFMEGKDAEELRVEYEALVRVAPAHRVATLVCALLCPLPLSYFVASTRYACTTCEQESYLIRKSQRILSAVVPVAASRGFGVTHFLHCTVLQDEDNSGELDLDEVLKLVQKVFGERLA